MREHKTLTGLLGWLEAAPDGTSIPAASLLVLLRDVERQPAPDAATAQVAIPAPGWRSRLWSCPPDTRLGKSELCEALGRSADWLYRHTSERAAEKREEKGRPAGRIPHRRFDGQLVFVAGEIRAWLRDSEEIMHAGPMETPASRRLRVVGDK